MHGRQLGRTIGVPTANLIPPVSKKFPPNGVYLTRSKIGEKEYDGISNVGYKPTVKENFLVWKHICLIVMKIYMDRKRK